MKIHQQNALLIIRKCKDIPTVEERKTYPRRSLKRDPSDQEPCCSKNIPNLEEFDIIVDWGAIGSEAVDDETEEIEADRHNLPVNIPLTDDDDLDYVLSEDKSSNTDDQSDSDNSNPDTRGRKLTRLAKHFRQRGITQKSKRKRNPVKRNQGVKFLQRNSQEALRLFGKMTVAKTKA